LTKSDRELLKKRKADYNRNRYKKDPVFKAKLKVSYRKWYTKNKKSVIDRITKSRQKNHSDYLQYQKEHYRYLKYRRKYASKSG
jgi:hypothetical protein